MTTAHLSTHPSPWLWQLARHEAGTLQPQPQPRWLKVEDGSVWLTRRNSGTERGDDVWLHAGDSLELPAGTAWVLEAWPAACVSLLQAAPRLRRGGAAALSWLPWRRAAVS